jgi:hypothetical protein
LFMSPLWLFQDQFLPPLNSLRQASLLPLQDFTVLPTKIFRRCVISSSLVIYLPTSSPMDYVRRLSLCR